MSTDTDSAATDPVIDATSVAENPTQAVGADSTASPASSSSNAESSMDMSNTSDANSSTPPVVDSIPAAAPIPVVVTPPAPVADKLGISAVSSDFVDFLVQKIVPFLDIIDIANSNDRRNAVIALKLNEDGIADIVDTARKVIKLQVEFANSTENSDLITGADLYTGKLARMVEWLGI